MEYLIVSFTHKNTDIQTREKLSFSNDLEKDSFLKTALEDENINEGFIVSTCNRIEIVLSVQTSKNSTINIIKSLANRGELNTTKLLEIADIYENEGAVHHLFTVASSLDSLVVGETQIVGQLKDAFKTAFEKGYAGVKLSRVMNYAFKCAARVRNITQLGTGSVSVASTAVAQAKSLYNNPTKVEALVIGAGEMSELACRHLLKSGFNVVVCSRNIKKAKVLAHNIIKDGNGEDYDASRIEVKPYDQLKILLNSMRLMVTATAAPYPIITKDMIEEYPYTRNWFDIALPRDIEVMDVEDVNIYSVDDLQCIVDETLELRASQAKQAFYIVSEMTNQFFIWLKTLSVEPLIKELYLQSDSIIEKRLDAAIKKHFIASENEENVKKLCKSVMAEFLHTPVNQLRHVAHSNECDSIINTTQDLFNIKEEQLIKNTKE
ncbi:MAG TPA: glutamyl-tRNA reductase [Arcobacter sp.]|jgi:glutamyl-tRNA reductase|nr:glutamyl-tRNA reductase [Arcobacter sp.]